jgi:peptide/nickel transport system permease protein
MQRYLLRRLAESILLLVGVLVLVFFLVRLTGDPARLMMPREASPEAIEAFRHEMGFDRPLLVQFVDFLVKVVQGDFGNSLRHRVPALRLVLERLPGTVELATAALAMAVVLGIPLGLLGGARPRSLWDAFARTLGSLAQSTPNFWLALILIVVFAVEFRLLPSFGRDDWRSVILPAVSLGLFTTGKVVRLTRSAVMEIRNEDYVRTAYSKGLAPRVIYLRHVLRNAAIPLISLLGVQYGYLLGGSIYIETIFSWPGLGFLLAEAVGNRDYPLIQAIAFFTSLVVVLLFLVADVLYAFADPRIRYGE